MPDDLQSRPYTPYGACRQVWESQAFEVLIAGPAGTGKTRSDLEKIHLACLKHKGCRALLLRKTRKELTETALPELEDKVFSPGWRKWFGNAKRNQRHSYQYPNGSILVTAGMDDPMKVLSSEWDRILVVEAVQLTEDDYEMLTTRCRATNTPYQQIICETNPNVPSHWLKRRAESGKMEFYTSTHRDNPKYWNQKTNTLTKEGKHYIENVLGNLTGSRRRRLLEGIWCADEAAIFDYDVLERHLARTREPDHCLKIGHKLDGAARDESIAAQRVDELTVKRVAMDKGVQNRLLWWGPLQVIDGMIRPPQDRTWVLSADISGGNGASNSVIAIADRNTRTKTGEWVSASISPGGLARVMAMLGLWCGGARGCGYLIWEANYPGPHFGRQLSRVLRYPMLHRRKTNEDQTVGGTGQQLGWVNNRTTLRDGIEALRDAYAADEFTNPSHAAIQEAMQWQRYPNGSVGPGHLVEESADARATHGDRVIADLQLVHAMDLVLPKVEKPKPITWAEQLLAEDEAESELDAIEEIEY